MKGTKVRNTHGTTFTVEGIRFDEANGIWVVEFTDGTGVPMTAFQSHFTPSPAKDYRFHITGLRDGAEVLNDDEIELSDYDWRQVRLEMSNAYEALCADEGCPQHILDEATDIVRAEIF